MVDDSIRDLCRICVEGSEDYICIYDRVAPDNTPFFYIINDVCQLDISEDDGFPEYICKDCFLKISEFMLFKRKSHEAKLNFLSMTVSLAEASPLKDLTGIDNEASVATRIIVEEASPTKDLSGLQNEAIMATSIIVKEMTSEGVTLGVSQPGDASEEVITMPFFVDYEEVVTADTYTLGEDQAYDDETEENMALMSVPVMEMETAKNGKRNRKEREVAVILADGSTTRLCQDKEKETKIVKDTGQEVEGNATFEDDEEEEIQASRRRSFVAQAYYRSYLLEKERKAEEEIMEEANKDNQDSEMEVEGEGEEVMEALDSNPGSPFDEPLRLEEDDEEPGHESPVIVEVAHVEDNDVNEYESQEVILTEPVVMDPSMSEEVSSEAVCCKKKMLAISKSLELSRSLEQSEKVAEPEIVVVGSDLDMLVEACGSRERRRASVRNKTRDAGGGVPFLTNEKVLKLQKMVKCANVPGVGNGTGKGRRNSMKAQDTGWPASPSDSSKPFIYAATRADRRGPVQGPRFRLSGGEPVPPKKIKKEAPKKRAAPATSDAGQGLEYIQVIASEELRAKRQQLDLEQVGDILKTSLSSKKTIQVSEVGPSGKVFHVEPTIVKLKSMPIGGGAHQILRPHNGASKESAKSGLADNLRTRRVSEGETGNGFAANGAKRKVEKAGERKGSGRSKFNNVELPLHSMTPPATVGTNPIALLGNSDGTTKTLLLTAPKEDNLDAPALAILLRPLKQEDQEEMAGDPILEIGRELSASVEVKEERGGEKRKDGVGSEDPQLVGEGTPSADPEVFCDRIRLRAKKAMLGCIKKTLDDLERMELSQKQGAADGERVLPDSVEYELVVKQERGRQSGEEDEEDEERVAEDATIYTCVHCGQSSYSKAEMGWHMKEAHSNDKQSSQFYCKKCDRCFSKRYIYRLHMEMHDMVLEGEEGAAATYEEGDVAPQGEEVSQQPCKCRFCGMLFSGKTAVLFHEAIKHQASPIYPCTICSRKFLTEEKREAHQSTCTGNRLECDICHKEYNVGSILQHMRTHRGEKPYLCAECGKTFSQKGDLKRHTRQIHLGLEPLKPFLCSYCPKTFSAQSKLRIHERSHTKEKPYKCDECGKGFAHLSTLRKHRDNREFACLPVIEQSTKPYTCSICKKGWDQKYALTKHIAWVHERKRPSRTFPCQYCSKVYYCRSQLTYHERTHTKEKPYVCGICDKSFMYNSVRKAHMAKEHGLKRNISDGPQ